jgi:hypothetical protein
MRSHSLYAVSYIYILYIYIYCIYIYIYGKLVVRDRWVRAMMFGSFVGACFGLPSAYCVVGLFPSVSSVLGNLLQLRCMHRSVRISGISDMKTVGWVYCGKCMWVILSRYLCGGASSGLGV